MGSRTVVDVWLADLTFPHYMDRLLRLGEEFDRTHPEYHIDIRGLDFRTLPLQIAQAVADGRAPALCEYYFTVTRAARDTRSRTGGPQFTSIEKAIGGRAEILGEPVVIGDLNPALRAYYTYDGDLTSMPSAGTTPVLFGNRNLLRAAGVTRMPATWDELEEVCRTLARHTSGPPYRITWANHGLFFQQALAVQGGSLCDYDNGRSSPATRVDLASAQMLAWVRFWQRLHQEGHYLYTGKIPDWAGTLRAFADQRVALRISSSADVSYMAQAAMDNGFELEVGRFPYNPRVPYAGNAVAGSSIWMSEGLDEATRDGALAFLQFMNNPRNDAARHKADSSIPVTNAGFELLAAEGWFDAHPYHRVANDQLGSYPPEYPGAGQPPLAGPPPAWGALSGDFAGVQDVMTRAMGDVLIDGAVPEERFVEATAEAQAMLDRYHEDCAGTGPRSATSLRVEYFAQAEAYSGVDLEDVAKLHS